MRHLFSCQATSLVLLLLAVSSAPAQGEVDLRPQQRFEEVLPALEKILAAPAAKLTDQQKKDIQVAVRGLIGPLTAHNRGGDVAMQAGPIKELTNKCFDWIKKVYEYEESKNTDAKEFFAEAMLADLRLVLMNSQQKPVVRVNAARVLDRLAASSRRETTAELIAQVIADPGQIDGVRYWAMRGLVNLESTSARGAPPVPLPDGIKEKATVALVQYIERKPPGVTKTTPADVLDGLRLVRKEAVRALASLRSAGTGKADGRAALTLARVMRKDKMLELEPRVDEQVEAALGLCHLPADPKTGYQPGYSAYQIALFANDFGNAFTQSNRSPRFPWKIYAAELLAGLQTMKQTHADNTLIQSVYDPAQQLLRSIELEANLVPAPLREWLMKNQGAMPPAMYEKDSGAVVQPAGAGNG